MISVNNFSNYLTVMCTLKNIRITDVMNIITSSKDINFPEVDSEIVNTIPSTTLNKTNKALRGIQKRLESYNSEFIDYWEIIINTMNKQYCKVVLYNATLGDNISTMCKYTEDLKQLNFSFKITAELESNEITTSLIDVPCVTYITWVSRKKLNKARKEKIKEISRRINGGI